MANAITNATHTSPEPVTPSQTTANTQAANQKAKELQSNTPNDTVTISSSAQTALQQSQTNQAQASKEANYTNQQAQGPIPKASANNKT